MDQVFITHGPLGENFISKQQHCLYLSFKHYSKVMVSSPSSVTSAQFLHLTLTLDCMASRSCLSPLGFPQPPELNIYRKEFVFSHHEPCCSHLSILVVNCFHRPFQARASEFTCFSLDFRSDPLIALKSVSLSPFALPNFIAQASIPGQLHSLVRVPMPSPSPL